MTDLILPASATGGPIFPLVIPFNPEDLFRKVYPTRAGMTRTYDGGRVNFLKGKFEGVTRQAIARGLSRLPRFLGQTDRAYSVAEHSIWVSRWLERIAENQFATRERVAAIALLGLVHDAHEAFTGDIPSPVKELPPLFAPILTLQGWLDSEIVRTVLGGSGPFKALHPDDFDLLHAGDKLALLVEHRDLRGGRNDPRMPQDKIIPIGDPAMIERMYLDELSALAPA